jgi:ferredoxin
MNARKLTFVLAVTALTLSLIACGGGGSSPTPPASVSVALSATPPTSLATSATLSLTANVSNDSANKGVTWTVSCGTSGACGSFSPTSTASGAATTYTAPSAVPSGNTVTVTATSVTDTTKTATATITITSTAPAITVTLSGTPPTSLVIGTTGSFTATIANDSANKGVTWTVTCGSSGACGSFSPTSTASGSPTTYTAPAAVPTNNTVTITATSVTDTT